MFATVSAFFHRWIGGIDPVDGGYKRVMIHPAPVKGIYDYAVGRKVNGGDLRVAWEIVEDRIEFELEVPKGVEVIWTPQLLRPDQLISIRNHEGKTSTSDKAQIIFGTPGVYKIVYQQ